MTVSSDVSLNTDLNKIDDVRGDITIEGGELSLNERNFDRQTHTHHNGRDNLLLISTSLFIFESLGNNSCRAVCV